LFGGLAFGAFESQHLSCKQGWRLLYDDTMFWSSDYSIIALELEDNIDVPSLRVVIQELQYCKEFQSKPQGSCLLNKSTPSPPF